MAKNGHSGMPTLIWRALELFWAARTGRRDGRLGIPYDIAIGPAGGTAQSGGAQRDGAQWDGVRTTEFMRTLAARAERRRTRVMRGFVRGAERDRGAMLRAAGAVIDLTRRLAQDGPAPAPDGGPASYPLSYADVQTARQARRRHERRQAAGRELADARQALSAAVSAFEAAVRQMRTDMAQITSWANEVAAHYRQALDAAYLERARRQGGTAPVPAWNPAPIAQHEAEERAVLSKDIVSLLPTGVADVVNEALRHLGGLAGEGGRA
ncbi:hypothetical protein SAMN05421833_10415 [Microbispora rosea]|uniref:Uncharacterized protein n=2 Tax=Microbispora rosea TaxID=58117 RepID=A0A1N6VYI6_9ACTN|nr:hypothetical protein SAMN05421833_10415 [Microbispora rosea]